MRCIVVTPEMTVLDQEATFVSLPLYDGELGVASRHTPLIGRLGAGELRITLPETSESGTSGSGKSGDGRVRYYVEGGFVEVLGDVVTLLTGRAIPVAQLDGSQSRQQLRDVLSEKAATEESIERRMRSADGLRSQIRLSERA